MLRALSVLVSTVRAAVRPRADLLLEIGALRQQLEVYQRQASPRRLLNQFATAAIIGVPIPRLVPAVIIKRYTM